VLGNRRTENDSRVQTIIMSECMCVKLVPVFSEAKSCRRQGKKCGYYVSKYSRSKQNCMLPLQSFLASSLLQPWAQSQLD